MIVDLFAGPGGWDVGARNLGLDALGIEFDGAAISTRSAARLPTLWADVSHVSPREYAGLTGLIASPPCQGFSNAGKKRGHDDWHLIEWAAKELDAETDANSDNVLEAVYARAADERTALVLEPLRWTIETRPAWLVCEQVPSVLPVWERYADVLRSREYSAWTGYVHAEQYGVPQTRKRAILLASCERYVEQPPPTHRKYRNGEPQSDGDPRLLPWVSMAEALGWGRRDLVGFPRRDDGRDAIEIDGEHYRSRDLREASRPAFAVTEKVRSWQRWEIDADALAEIVKERARDQTGTPFDPTWPATRPANTIATRGLVTHPGPNANRYNGSTKSRNDGIRITVEEAALLQSFPSGYPWAGAESKKFQQIGNAVPPPLAEAILRTVTGLDEGNADG